MALSAGRRNDGGSLSEQLSDPAELVRHGDRLEAGARLVGFDELLRERVESAHGFLHRDLPADVERIRLTRGARAAF